MRGGVEVRPVGGIIGAEVLGVDSKSVFDEGVAGICLDALEAHGVIFFRRLNLDDAAQVAFTRSLGEPVVLAGAAGPHPEIYKITLDPKQSRSAEYLKGTFYWHIDGATDDVPTRGTLLSARALAEEGGDTEFASTYAAYEALPAEERERLCELRVVHSLEASQRLIHPNPSAEELATCGRRGEKEQPLVWHHRSGRRSLVLGATAGRVVGMGDEDGHELLERLLEFSTQPRFVYRHRWQVGALG